VVQRMIRDVGLVWYGRAHKWYGRVYDGNRPWLPNYDAYRDMLASSLIYFSPTRRAPMPGSRTEAALSGCCVVSVPGNDWEDYVDDWETGVMVNNYTEARDALRYLLANPEETYRIGQRGREMARDAFGVDRFVGDWLKVLAEIGVVA